MSSLATVMRSIFSPRSCRLAHALEDAPVALKAEVVGLERAGGLDVQNVVEQNRAEHESLGVYIGGKTLFNRN